MKLDTNLNYVTQADGSAFYTQNGSCVVVAVIGPAEVKMHNELVDKAYVNVVFRPLIGVPGVREKSIEAHLRGLFDGIILTNQHPRTSININIQEIDNYGSFVSCIINCACLAFLDANLPLKYTFAAVTCGLKTDNEDEIVYYPNEEEEKKCSILVTFVFDSINQTILFIDTNGVYTKKQFTYLHDNAKIHSQNVFNYYRQVMLNKYKKYL